MKTDLTNCRKLLKDTQEEKHRLEVENQQVVLSYYLPIYVSIFVSTACDQWIVIQYI